MDWLAIISAGICGGLAALIAQVGTGGGPYTVAAGRGKTYRISWFVVFLFSWLLLQSFVLPRIQVWLH